MIYIGLVVVALVNGFFISAMEQLERNDKKFFGNKVICLQLKKYELGNSTDIDKEKYIVEECAFPKKMIKASHFAIKNTQGDARTLLLSNNAPEIIFAKKLGNLDQNYTGFDFECEKYKNAYYFVLLNTEKKVVDVLSRAGLRAVNSTYRIRTMADFDYQDPVGEKIDGFINLYNLSLCNHEGFLMVANKVCAIGGQWCQTYEHVEQKSILETSINEIVTGEIQNLIRAFEGIPVVSVSAGRQLWEYAIYSVLGLVTITILYKMLLR